MFFGVFSTELLTLPCKITEVGRLSLFIESFVGFHIVCDRYTQDNAHFTYSNTIWPLSLSSTFGNAFITGSHIVSYSAQALEAITSSLFPSSLYSLLSLRCLFSQLSLLLLLYWIHPITVLWRWRSLEHIFALQRMEVTFRRSSLLLVSVCNVYILPVLSCCIGSSSGRKTGFGTNRTTTTFRTNILICCKGGD